MTSSRFFTVRGGIAGLAILGYLALQAAESSDENSPRGRADSSERPAAPFEWRGKMAMGTDYLFSIRSTQLSGKAQWLPLRGVIAGYTLADYDSASEVLILKRGDEIQKVRLLNSPIRDDQSDARALDRARMMRIRPALAAGTPLKGTLLLMNEGKAEEHDLELVMGKPISVAVADGGSILLTPKLKDDGSVEYAFSLKTQEPNGILRERSTQIVQTPWGEFAAMIGGRTFAFVPNADDPVLK